MKKKELYAIAQRLNIPRRSYMSKAELARAIEAIVPNYSNMSKAELARAIKKAKKSKSKSKKSKSKSKSKSKKSKSKSKCAGVLCSENQICNPKSGRCVKITGAIGSKLVLERRRTRALDAIKPIPEAIDGIRIPKHHIQVFTECKDFIKSLTPAEAQIINSGQSWPTWYYLLNNLPGPKYIEDLPIGFNPTICRNNPECIKYYTKCYWLSKGLNLVLPGLENVHEAFIDVFTRLGLPPKRIDTPEWKRMYWKKMRGEDTDYVKVATIFASEGIEEWTSLNGEGGLGGEELYPLEMLTRESECQVLLESERMERDLVPPSPYMTCPSVERIIFPKSLLKIEMRAFKGWGLREVDLSNTKLTEISNAAFMHCVNLTSVVFPEGLKHIAPNAFIGCANLGPELTFPKGLLRIDWYAFARCKNLKRVNISRRTAIGLLQGRAHAFDIGVEINYID